MLEGSRCNETRQNTETWPPAPQWGYGGMFIFCGTCMCTPAELRCTILYASEWPRPVRAISNMPRQSSYSALSCVENRM